MNFKTKHIYIFFLIKILLLNTIEAKNINYILPEEENLAKFVLQTAFQHTNHSIILKVNKLDYQTKKLLIGKADVNISILTNCNILDKNIFELTLYKHINIFCITATPIEIMFFDEKFLCLQLDNNFSCSEDIASQ